MPGKERSAGMRKQGGRSTGRRDWEGILSFRSGVPEAAGAKVEAGDGGGIPSDGIRGVHLAGGDPQDAEFCDGPGPGMALEQNSFLPPTTPGQGMTVVSGSDRAA